MSDEQNKESPLEEPQEDVVVPIEIIFHMAAFRVQKNLGFVELSLISPTGIAATVTMNQEVANQLAGNLAEDEDKPKVDTFTSMPGLLR